MIDFVFFESEFRRIIISINCITYVVQLSKFFLFLSSREHFDLEFLENWFSKLQGKKWKGSTIFTSLEAT